MLNILKVLKRDFLRLLKAPAALIVVLVLIVLPSTYTWFNVVGFWNPYDNTSNMRVCIVNEDTGASNNLIGSMNIGEQIESTLYENTQLKWVFTTYDDAMEQVNSGSAYAAFIIPENFTENLFTILSENFDQPTIQYYVNEKVNPVSPKVTDVGSSTLDTTINSQFTAQVTQTVSDVLQEKIAEATGGVESAQTSAAAKLNNAKAQVSSARSDLASVRDATSTSQEKVKASKDKLNTVRSDAAYLQNTLQQVSDLSNALEGEISSFSEQAPQTVAGGTLELSQAASNSNANAASLISAVTKAQSSADAALMRAQGTLDVALDTTETLQAIVDALPEGTDAKQQLQDAVDNLNYESSKAQTTLDNLQAVSGSVEQSVTAVSDASNSINTAAQTTINAASAFSGHLFTNTLPNASIATSKAGALATTLKAQVAAQGTLIDETSAVLDQLDTTLDAAQTAISQTDGILGRLEQTLNTAANNVSAISTSSAISNLVSSGKIDSAKLAEFMASPAKVTTEKLYPLNAYGSAMAPLFISLSLWIGTIMLCVILKLEVDNERVENLTVVQGFLARFLFFAVLSALQACVCVAGCLYLGVQTVDVLTFYLTAIALSLTYLCITYTLSASMQHIGIGLCIILVFVQIPGGTGLYPVEMTDSFFRAVYPFFPFTYGINALRETIGGFYGAQYAQYMGTLGLIAAVMLAFGLFVRPRLTNLNRLFAHQVAESDLLNGEDALVPKRRLRASQLLKLLSNHKEFHAKQIQSQKRFMFAYPFLKRGALVVGILVPAAAVLLFATNVTNKVGLLTIWLVWLIAIMAFLIVVEYVRYNIKAQGEIDEMSEAEIREVIGQKLKARGQK